jgi:sugar lactone lactonase YvrE
MGANDRLYTYSPSTGQIVSSNTATGTASGQKTIARNLAAVVDFVVTETGTIYFLDGSTATIGVIDSSGQPRVALRWTDLGAEMTAPKGLALSPDQSMLVVTDTVSRYSWSFQIAADGTLENGEPFYRLELPETTVMSWQSGTRGAVEDVNGMVYFATPLGIQISMQNGRVMEILNPPVPGAPITAHAFASGRDQSWLYIAENGKLYRRPVMVTGANAWTVVKPPKPTL